MKRETTFGARVRELRLKWKMTQAELAHKTGLSQSWINHIERGRRLPSHRVLAALAKAFGYGCDELRAMMKD